MTDEEAYDYVAFLKLKGGPYQWDYASIPQRHSNGRRIPLAQGRVTGQRRVH